MDEFPGELKKLEYQGLDCKHFQGLAPNVIIQILLKCGDLK